jgi:hypothetical protein
MRILLLAGGCLFLLVVNVLAFATFVPLRPSAVVAYLTQMAVATLLAPGLVLLGLLTRRRFRNPRSLLRGVLAGLAASLIATATSVALSPPPPQTALTAWDAAEKQAHLDRRCRERCFNNGTKQAVCDRMCACTMEALFSGRSDEELMRLTVEGPYGMLSRETNQLLGELGMQCAEEIRGAKTASSHPARQP